MALPTDFIPRMHALLGDEFAHLEAALQAEVPVSIRLNPAKPLAHLPALVAERVGWSRAGYYLPERLSFTFDPLFHAGAYYVQEASSMFLEQAIATYVTEPVHCLDLCAAPGGKSTHLLSLLPTGSLLVCNEVIRSRSHILAENIAKWGHPEVVVTNNDPEELGGLTHLFDLIVADVPCSGEGMFRKDSDSTAEWSVANVNLCAARSRRIIHDIWEALKPGGLLIYSTCTYNTEEDEENIHYITQELGAEALPIPLEEAWQVSGARKYDHPVYRFFPHKTRGEGFFLALLRKAEGEQTPLRVKAKGKRERTKALPVVPAEVKHYLKEGLPFSPEWVGNELWMLPPAVQEVYLLLNERLRILAAGLPLGELKGRDFVPAHPLALSTALSPEAFPRVSLSWVEAIQYLRKEALTLPEDTPRGYVLVEYNHFPLGFVKHLGNRANNLYPSEWRIRTGYLPEKIALLEQLCRE